MRFIADLHIHSRYSRATSGDCTPEELHRWAACKGLSLVGTGDFTHPAWREELRQKLEPAGEAYGIYRLKDEFRKSASRRAAAEGIPWLDTPRVGFIIAGEISTIYKKAGAVRKIHHLILLPSLEAADELSRRLEQVGNIHSDGRPILGLDSRVLLEITLEACPDALFIPAHIWTPHFSLFGANSGFDAIEECFDDLTGHIYAVETGLSSDPPMNWRLSALDRFALVSNSDAHSPANLAREANIFDTELSFDAIRKALRDRDPARFIGTLEFFPEEGKYHYDGHRACGVRWKPSETRAAGGVCPVCGRKVTVGVLHRVEELADRPEGAKPPAARHFESLVPLAQVIASALGVGESSRQVREQYTALIRALGPELAVLRESSLEDVRSAASPAAGAAIAEAIRRVRAGEIEIKPGFDGEYGSIVVMRDEDRKRLRGQGSLFGSLFAGAAPASCASRDLHGSAAASVAAVAAPRISEPGESRERGIPIGTGEPSKSPSSVSPVPGEPVRPTASAAPLPADGLNRAQREAVMAESGPIIVIAGPGTGKTRTLAHRIAYLVGERNVNPAQITAVTFTNKAAAEMRARVKDLLNDPDPDSANQGSHAGHLEGLTIGTFHSICLDMLKACAGHTGSKTMIILDEFDARSVLEEVLKESRVGRGINAREAQRQISLLKGRGIRPPEAGALVPGELSRIYSAYQERLAHYMALDYDDILLETAHLMRRERRREGRESCLPEGWLDRFTYLLVDEFQDVNPIQYELVKLWAGDGTRLFVIGDPDQAIYGFRGADHRFFERLREDFPASKVYKLTINYRSTPQILGAASALIAHNLDCAGLKLEAAKSNGFRIRHIEVPGEIAEGIAIVREIGRMVGGATMLQAHQASGQGGGSDPRGGPAPGEPAATSLQDITRSFSDIAVLFRTGRQGEVLEECFLKEGIPYRIVGRESFLEDRDVRAALDFLRCVVNPADEFHFSRCLVSNASAGGDPEALKARIEAYRNLSVSEPPDRLLARWIEEESACNPGSRGNEAVRRLMRVASRFDSLESFIVGINLAREADHERPGPRGRTSASPATAATAASTSAPEAVTLMTMHAAKGLEFPVVFIAGVEEGIIPLKGSPGVDSTGATDTGEDNDPEISEERRLFYVGMTRAMDELILLSAHRRAQSGTSRPATPSRFLDEIPPDFIQREVRSAKPKGGKANKGCDGRPDGQLSLFAPS
ncbi:MAG TPA: UvrD-helicase domain-containing protein [Firmicutes bacterium]|nr:UvrD-helicase domain-containing protein [Bacillota bacterium]